jgi:ribokinase
MTITVIGHITQDTLIFPPSGWRVVESLGGTLYTVSALASLTNDPIRLVCNIGDDVLDSAIIALRRFPNVDTSGVQRVKGPHFHCYILFASEYGTQYDEGTEMPIKFSQVKPFLDDSKFVLVSLMTGFDLKLSTLRQIKRAARCPVYLDYHILALDRDPLGNRFLRRRKNWLQWCISCDHLQLNQFEAESLSLFPLKTEEEMARFSRPILDSGVRSVAVTLGSEGALVSWKEDGIGIQVKRIETTPVSDVVDATGCGDVFAAGFIVHFLQTQDILVSYEFANRIAGLKCGFSGFEHLADVLSSMPTDSEASLR